MRSVARAPARIRTLFVFRHGDLPSVFAEFERAMIQERVRAGLRRAVSEGKQLGRPPLNPELEERVRKALNARRETGEGVRKIAQRFRLSPTTVQKISRPFEVANAAA
jgi:DNA invertase Pin-like site-specific DNA recombinase